MPVVWSDRCLLHEPDAEIWVGVRTDATEVPARITAIRDALGARVVEAEPHPDEALHEVHDSELPAYLASAWAEWEAAGLPADPGQDRVVPYVFAHSSLGARRVPAAAWARPGYYAYDTMTLVGPGHLGGGAGGRRLCPDRGRPRARRRAGRRTRCAGRRATTRRRAGYGGSCYLNNAAVAAAALPSPGRERVGVRRRRRPPRQRHAGDLLRAAPTCSTARCTSTRARAGSRTSSASRTRRAGPAGEPQPAAAAGSG